MPNTSNSWVASLPHATVASNSWILRSTPTLRRSPWTASDSFCQVEPVKA